MKNGLSHYLTYLVLLDLSISTDKQEYIKKLFKSEDWEQLEKLIIYELQKE